MKTKTSKLCSKCKRSVKGHKQPVGIHCTLSVLSNDQDNITDVITIEHTDKVLHTVRTIRRKCTSCKRWIKGHPTPIGKHCAFSKAVLVGDQNYFAEATLEKQTSARKSKRDSNRRCYEKRKSRCLNVGWNNTNSASTCQHGPVDAFTVPLMSKVCCKCGASMFPFEKHTTSGNGNHAFSLCCSYGRYVFKKFDIIHGLF